MRRRPWRNKRHWIVVWPLGEQCRAFCVEASLVSRCQVRVYVFQVSYSGCLTWRLCVCLSIHVCMRDSIITSSQSMLAVALWPCGTLPGSRSCSSGNPAWGRPRGRPQNSWPRQVDGSCWDLLGTEREPAAWRLAGHDHQEWCLRIGEERRPQVTCMPPPID